MGDLVGRVFNVPITFDLIAGGIFAGALFWKFGDWGSIFLSAGQVAKTAAEDTAKGAIHAVFDNTNFGKKIDYNAKIPLVDNGWQKDWNTDVGTNVRNKMKVWFNVNI